MLQEKIENDHGDEIVWKGAENEGSGQFITFFTLTRVLLLSVGTQAVETRCGLMPWRGVWVCWGAGALPVVVSAGYRQAQLGSFLPVPMAGAPGLCRAVAGEKSTVAGLAQMCLQLRMKEFPM